MSNKEEINQKIYEKYMTPDSETDKKKFSKEELEHRRKYRAELTKKRTIVDFSVGFPKGTSNYII